MDDEHLATAFTLHFSAVKGEYLFCFSLFFGGAEI
jgi:hypothetical protein